MLHYAGVHVPLERDIIYWAKGAGVSTDIAAAASTWVLAALIAVSHLPLIGRSRGRPGSDLPEDADNSRTLLIAGLILAAFNGSALWMVLCAATMVVTFLAGASFTALLPTTHLDKFREAMSHGEILLMVDVPFYRLVEVEAALRHHPEATPGGCCWHLSVLGH